MSAKPLPASAVSINRYNKKNSTCSGSNNTIDIEKRRRDINTKPTMTKTNFIYALSVALIAFIADVSAFSARASPKTPPQAPVIKVSAYEEALPMLYCK